jgi:hypothetical protein
MKSNFKLVMYKPYDVNLVTKLWRTFSSSLIVEHKIIEYIKLSEFDIVQIIRSIEDKRRFSTLTFMKSKLRNILSTCMMELVVQMFN